MKQTQLNNIIISHEDYPSSLNKNELLDPFSVIEDFFGTYSLFHAKQYLWESIKYNLVDINTVTVEMRPVYYKFLLNLERVIDASWLLNQYNSIQELTIVHPLSKKMLKTWRDDNFISFLNPYECTNLTRVVTNFFSYQPLCEWKTIYLESLRKTILEPKYFMFLDCNTLKAFLDFNKFSKLLESLFLLQAQYSKKSNSHSALTIKKLNYDHQMVIKEWLIDYMNQNKVLDNLQHFVNICHAQRFIHVWKDYNVYKIFESYEIIEKITLSTTTFLNTESISTLPISIQQKVKKTKTWTPGRSTRFLRGLLLNSRTFSKRYKAYVSPRKEIDYITYLIIMAHEISKYEK